MILSVCFYSAHLSYRRMACVFLHGLGWKEGSLDEWDEQKELLERQLQKAGMQEG